MELQLLDVSLIDLSIMNYLKNLPQNQNAPYNKQYEDLETLYLMQDTLNGWRKWSRESLVYTFCNMH